MTDLRGFQKSSTLKEYLTDIDGNKHDAIISLSAVTRQGGYDCRATLTFPFEAASGAQNDAVLKRGSVSLSTFISFNTLGQTEWFGNFLLIARQLSFISGFSALEEPGCFALAVDEFALLTDNLVDSTTTAPIKSDADVAYVSQTRPAV